jgi:hypothetical protein
MLFFYYYIKNILFDLFNYNVLFDFLHGNRYILLIGIFIE